MAAIYKCDGQEGFFAFRYVLSEIGSGIRSSFMRSQVIGLKFSRVPKLNQDRYLERGWSARLHNDACARAPNVDRLISLALVGHGIRYEKHGIGPPTATAVCQASSPISRKHIQSGESEWLRANKSRDGQSSRAASKRIAFHAVPYYPTRPLC
jgi:hypothetical protein